MDVVFLHLALRSLFCFNNAIIADEKHKLFLRPTILQLNPGTVNGSLRLK